MNVLLAEADVPYRIVKEMSEVNKQMSEYDVAIVVGANDTVNPASLEPSTKIYGMPVIEVWKAKRVIVLKRSLAPGYAAIDNPLFFLDNTRMLFGNAKDTTAAIFASLSQIFNAGAAGETPHLAGGAATFSYLTDLGLLQGYRAVLEAFAAFPRLSKASITAAGEFDSNNRIESSVEERLTPGRVDAARVLVLGAGVAGLQAISTAHGLQAQVFAYDVRSATREEVESCGGTFLSVEVVSETFIHVLLFLRNLPQYQEEEGEVEGGYAREMGEAHERAQKKMLSRVVPNVDVIICTAAIHGKPSPKLISNDMLAGMRPGSVVIDLATEFGDRRSGWGGNVEGSPTDGETQVHGVTVMGRSHIETHM
nr:TPA: NAD(P) transhydrogenase subunit beta [Neospora caninum Liverpool]